MIKIRSIQYIGLGLLFFFLIASISFLSAVPPIDRDALTHHLFVPKLYIRHGGIHEIPSVAFSYYPMNLDLLYLVPLYFGNDIVPKFIHFFFGMMTSWFIFDYLKRRLSAEYGLLGALFFLSLPIIVKLSVTVYVDLGLIFFSTGSLIYVFKWIESRFRLKFLLISGMYCGLALGTKYNGLITCFLLTLFVPFIYSRLNHDHDGQVLGDGKSILNQLRGIGYGAVFIAVSILVFSPWMIKNYIWTNNPIYPLHNGWFNPPDDKSIDPILRGDTEGEGAGESVQRAPRPGGKIPPVESDIDSMKSKGPLGHFAFRKLAYGEPWWKTFAIPVTIFFKGQDNDPRFFDGRLHPLLFFLPFFAFLNLKSDPVALKTEKIILLFFSVLFLIFVFFQIDMRIRWISPIIPPLTILSMLGLHGLSTVIRRRFTPSSGRLWNALFLTAVVVLIIVPNAIYVKGLFHYVDPFSYLSGRINRDEYIERFRPEYAIIRHINANLPEDARILGMLMGNRGYYFDREVIFTEGLFWGGLKRAGRAKELMEDLKMERVSHLMIQIELFNKWVNDNFEDDKKDVLTQFFNQHARLRFSKGGYGLFELRS